MLTNIEIADRLEYLGKLYQVAKDTWRSKTFIKAASIVRDMRNHVTEFDYADVHGIGKSTAEIIKEIVESKTCARIKELEKKFPPGALALQVIPGVGPVGAYEITRKYNVMSVEELIKVLESKKEDPELLRKAKIGFEQMKQGRLPRKVVYSLVEKLQKSLKAIDHVEFVSPAGSYRREAETIGDIDILVSIDPTVEREVVVSNIASVLRSFGEVKTEGKTKISLRHNSNFIVDVDVLMVEPKSWGSALCYFTGSKSHNIKLRSLAKSKGILVNEYGFFQGPNAANGTMDENERIGGRYETDLYETLGLQFVQPRDRSE